MTGHPGYLWRVRIASGKQGPEFEPGQHLSVARDKGNQQRNTKFPLKVREFVPGHGQMMPDRCWDSGLDVLFMGSYALVCIW